jgi:hypothetical protein
MERLSAEYLTLATAAQAERWDTLLAGAGFTEAELQSVRCSEALGQLTGSLRRAEARGLDVYAPCHDWSAAAPLTVPETLPRPSRRG